MVKRAGGVAAVQDPDEAMHPGMPASAIDKVPVDHVVRTAGMADLLAELAVERAQEQTLEVPQMSELRLPFVDSAGGVDEQDIPGTPSGLTCPE